MAGFRQEDVELHYEMGEELGRYGQFFFYSLLLMMTETGDK